MRITSKKEFIRVLEEDAKANRRRSLRPNFWGDEIWKFIYRLRKCEYYSSFSGIKRILIRPFFLYNKLRLHKLSLLCGFSIPTGRIDEGFSIAHTGTIIINGNCKIGKNFRVQDGVTIGSTNGSDKAPTIGDNVFVGSGAKIIGNIEIADNVAIGANAVVVKSIMEKGTTWGGVPAKKISNNSSHSNLSSMLNL